MLRFVDFFGYDLLTSAGAGRRVPHLFICRAIWGGFFSTVTEFALIFLTSD